MGDSGESDVLVVGAGPSGLFAAAELARHGVRARVVERERHPHHQARATALQPATLEILKQAGFVDRVLESSVHLEYARLFDAGLTCVAELAFAGVGCPWEFQCCLPQWRTEEILAGRLAELGGSVERGVTVMSLTERESSVLAELEEADGTVRTVEAAAVIGAGGAHSITRESMAQELVGSTYSGSGLVGDVRVSCGLPRDGSALVATRAGYVLLAPLPGERWLTFVGDLDETEAQVLANDRSHDSVAAAIGRRIPDALLTLDDVGWASIFQMHRRLAPRLADTRRFLLGDAGHLSSPWGGEGLNSGLHDAHNLAWKLALWQHGHARPGLVESFAAERMTADRHVLEVSDRLHALAHASVEAARAGSFPAPPQPDDARRMAISRSMLDVSYAGSPLVGEYLAPGGPPPLPDPAPGSRYSDRTSLGGTRHHLLLFGTASESDVTYLGRRWDGIVDVVVGRGDPRRAGLAGEGAILIRPDGYIGFRAVPADEAGLRAVDAHLNSYLVPQVPQVPLVPVAT
jgi:6-methylpretetramide 4-monooxygenase / 4-hydroxy-6-methylpretetramide 12a-monooxygenase